MVYRLGWRALDCRNALHLWRRLWETTGKAGVA